MSQVQGEQHRNKKENQEEEDRKQNNLIGCKLVVMSYCVNRCSGSTHGSSWAVDSRASFHDTSTRRLFTTYKSGFFGEVRMCNHEKCKVIGIGDMSVVINMGHTLTLRNVF